MSSASTSKINLRDPKIQGLIGAVVIGIVVTLLVTIKPKFVMNTDKSGEQHISIYKVTGMAAITLVVLVLAFYAYTGENPFFM